MRSIKLVPALAAAATLLALAPAGAIARPAARTHAIRSGNCRVSISAEPRVITAGESVAVKGTPHCPGGATTASLPVTVYQHEVTTTALKLVGSATTAPFELTSSPLMHDSIFYVVAAGRRTASRQVRVGPAVVLNGPAGVPAGAQILTGGHNKVAFSGTVSPEDNGATVYLEREDATSNEEWHPIAQGVVRGSAFSIVHGFGVPGAVNLRAVVRPRGPFSARGISSPLSYVISQTQNPKLTILSSADPASYGQSVTISGVVAGAAAGTPVTLLAHTRTGPAGFTAVAKGTTESGGAYKFTGQLALQNVSYRVTTASAKSAVLFEGVKNVLSVTSVPAATMLSGQTFTVGGQVTPPRTGHVVYLERENAFQGGFHVVDVGTLTEKGAFSIQYTVASSAKPENFRIKVPGDPTLEAVSSAPFTTQVSLAPPGPLLPAAPVTLPH